MKPIVHGLEAAYWDQIDFVYLDIDDPFNRPVMDTYAFRYQPTFVLVQADGTEAQRWQGYVDEATLRAGLDALLASLN